MFNDAHSFFQALRATPLQDYYSIFYLFGFRRQYLYPFRAPTEDLVSAFFASLRIIGWHKIFCGKHDA